MQHFFFWWWIPFDLGGHLAARRTTHTLFYIYKVQSFYTPANWYTNKPIMSDYKDHTCIIINFAPHPVNVRSLTSSNLFFFLFFFGQKKLTMKGPFVISDSSEPTVNSKLILKKINSFVWWKDVRQVLTHVCMYYGFPVPRRVRWDDEYTTLDDLKCTSRAELSFLFSNKTKERKETLKKNHTI